MVLVLKEILMFSLIISGVALIAASIALMAKFSDYLHEFLYEAIEIGRKDVRSVVHYLPVNFIEFVFATFLIYIMLLFFILTSENDKGFGVNFVQDFGANISTESAGILITVFVVGWLTNKRVLAQRKKEIIQQMGSRSNDFALEAVRIITNEGWHIDGSLRNANLEKANLQGADLQHAKLEKANLQRANLQCAQLHYADLPLAFLKQAHLQGAKLHGADLRGANLQFSDLRRASLDSADLRLARLESADLQDAVLMFSHLQGAVLTQARLQGAKLQRAKYNTDTQWPDGFDPTDPEHGLKLVDIDYRTQQD